MIGYSDWQAFRFRGRRFLAITRNGGNVCIYGPGSGSYYGSYRAVNEFRRLYASQGEKLNLNIPADAA